MWPAGKLQERKAAFLWVLVGPCLVRTLQIHAKPLGERLLQLVPSTTHSEA